MSAGCRVRHQALRVDTKQHISPLKVALMQGQPTAVQAERCSAVSLSQAMGIEFRATRQPGVAVPTQFAASLRLG
jgi:hypothetical protein